MCGFTLSESTVERVTEEAGLRLKQVLDEGQTVGENKPYSWHRDANGQTCAYVSLDATGVPQQGPGGVSAECRMVYVGKVYNPVCGDQTKTSKPASARYVATICNLEKMGLLLRRQATAVGFDDAQQQLAISDGGAGLEDLFRQRFPRAEIMLDFWHAREHLVELAQAIFPCDVATRTSWMEARSHQLKHEGGQSVLTFLETLDLSGLSAAGRQSYAEHVGYYRNHVHKMDYPRYIANGWQIGSGPVEAACKTVVGRRLKQSGMRWGVAGADCAQSPSSTTPKRTPPLASLLAKLPPLSPTNVTPTPSRPAALRGPLPIHGLGHRFFGLVNHAGPLADEALRHVAERVVGIKLADQLGLLPRPRHDGLACYRKRSGPHGPGQSPADSGPAIPAGSRPRPVCRLVAVQWLRRTACRELTWGRQERVRIGRGSEISHLVYRTWVPRTRGERHKQDANCRGRPAAFFAQFFAFCTAGSPGGFERIRWRICSVRHNPANPQGPSDR